MMLKFYFLVTISTCFQSFDTVAGFVLSEKNGTDDVIERVFNTTFINSTADGLENSRISLRMVTSCETPNGNLGLCLGIKNCPSLLSKLTDEAAWGFLRASMCRPYSENTQNPKVCCVKTTSNKKSQQVTDQVAAEDKILPKGCGKQRKMISDRILGGTEAALGEFPWMARLEHKTKRGLRSFGCSGFLVSSKYVLTAAHCVDQKFVRMRGPLYSVVLGEHDSETKIDCDRRNRSCADPLQISRVSNVIVHPQYDANSSSHHNDIALVRLNKGARMTEYVQPICLTTEPNVDFQNYWLSGWGVTSDSGELSTIKMKVDVPAAEKTACTERYSAVGIDLVDTQICAGGELGKDSCGGDSGGPLMAFAEKWFAAGVVSFGLGCGVEEWPGVYTRVRDFVPWVRRTIVETDAVQVKRPAKNNVKKKRPRQVVE